MRIFRNFRSAALAAVVPAFLVGVAAPVAPAQAAESAVSQRSSNDGPTGAAADANFGIAVIPDTQTEVGPNDPRFAGRTRWLVDNKSKLDLRHVVHTGDVTNWGWLDPSQISVAKTAMDVLRTGGLDYSIAVGNHDTAAVGTDGSAYAEKPECAQKLGAAACKTNLLVRNTDAVNKGFPLASLSKTGGVFESGKIDNRWTTFEAGGRKWLVLTLELYPRKEAVAWGSKVVADHPHHNVIVNTHSYMTGDGNIDGSNGGYGATSGQYVFDHLVKLHSNVKFVLSGHTGIAAKRTDKGKAGNTIVSYLGTFHSPTTNPVRILNIDVASGKVTSKMVAPHTGETLDQYATSDKVSFVR